MWPRAGRVVTTFAAVAGLTWLTAVGIPVNPTTAGFAYLLLVLAIASVWGFYEAALASFLATFGFNYFYFPPTGRLTINDPGNWVALFAFLTTALIASRLSTAARRRAAEALARELEIERLYEFSRSILLSSGGESFPLALIRGLAAAFDLAGAVLYDRRIDAFFYAGPANCDGLESRLREAAHAPAAPDLEIPPSTPAPLHIVPVRLGAEPIASLALAGAAVSESVLQNIAGVTAIGLERARAQDLAHQAEVARRGEQLRATLADAMAHEFKTPLTLIKAATTSLLGGADPLSPSSREQLTIADEEADHLRELLDNTIEIASLDASGWQLELAPASLSLIVEDVAAAFASRLAGRPLHRTLHPQPPVLVDRRLIRLALQQLLDNALKYSPAEAPISIHLGSTASAATVAISNPGPGIPFEHQPRIFDRYYRLPSVRSRIPGSGLGLNIAQRIVQAHGGALVLSSRPGLTTFTLSLPLQAVALTGAPASGGPR